MCQLSQSLLNARRRFRQLLGLPRDIEVSARSGNIRSDSESSDDSNSDSDDEQELIPEPPLVRYDNYLVKNINSTCTSNLQDGSEKYIDGITYDSLQEGNTIQASDGNCYNSDTLITIYNDARASGNLPTLPFNRAPFTDDDIRKVRTAIADKQVNPNPNGGKKRKTHKRKTYKRKTYKRKTHKRKTYKRKTYKRKTKSR
jgi:hypothetical protein